MMAGDLGQVALNGAKSGGNLFFGNPFNKWALIITAIFFLIFATIGTMESFQQKSVYPLIDRTIFKVMASDSQLGQSIDVIESQERPTFDGFFAKSFPPYLWFWLKFWLDVIGNLYFIVFFIWLLYMFFNSLNNSELLLNIGKAILSFCFIQVIFGLLIFGMNINNNYDSITYENSNYVKVPAKLDYFNDAIKYSYPFHGAIKFFHHWINGDLYYKIERISNTEIGSIITGIPISNGTILNYTGG